MADGSRVLYRRDIEWSYREYDFMETNLIVPGYVFIDKTVLIACDTKE